MWLRRLIEQKRLAPKQGHTEMEMCRNETKPCRYSKPVNRPAESQAEKIANIKRAALSGLLGRAGRLMTSKPVTDFAIPGAVGAAAGGVAYNEGFSPLESAFIGLGTASIGNPRTYANAWRLGKNSPEGPIPGTFTQLAKPIGIKAGLTGLALAPGALTNISKELENRQQISSELAAGTKGFSETGQKIQKGLTDTAENVAGASKSLNSVGSKIDALPGMVAGGYGAVKNDIGRAFESVRGDLESQLKNVADKAQVNFDSVKGGLRGVFFGLAGAVGAYGAYKILSRVLTHKEKQEAEETKRQKLLLQPKRRPITIDPGDSDVDVSMVQKMLPSGV